VCAESKNKIEPGVNVRSLSPIEIPLVEKSTLIWVRAVLTVLLVGQRSVQSLFEFGISGPELSELFPSNEIFPASDILQVDFFPFVVGVCPRTSLETTSWCLIP